MLAPGLTHELRTVLELRALDDARWIGLAGWLATEWRVEEIIGELLPRWARELFDEGGRAFRAGRAPFRPRGATDGEIRRLVDVVARVAETSGAVGRGACHGCKAAELLDLLASERRRRRTA